MKNGHFSKAAAAADTTKILRKTRFCIALISFNLHHARCKIVQHEKCIYLWK